MKNLLIAIVAIILFTSCSPNVSKLLDKGNSNLRKGNYEKAIKDFNKAAAKSTYSNDMAYHGIAMAYEGQNSIQNAILFEEKAYKTNSSNPDYTFNLARFNAKLDQESNALYWLYKTGEISTNSSRSIDYYVGAARNDRSLNNIYYNEKYQRFLGGGYRRIKIKIKSAYTSKGQDFLGNATDHFGVVSAITPSGRSKIILCTDTQHDDNSVDFYGEYVIFDYKLGTNVFIGHYDEDISTLDYMSGYKGLIPANLDNLSETIPYYGKMKFEITDSESSTYTSGIEIPETLSARDILIGVGAAALIYSASEMSAKEEKLSNLNFGDICSIDLDYRIPSSLMDHITGSNKYKAIFEIKILEGNYTSEKVKAKVVDLKIGYGSFFNSYNKIKNRGNAYKQFISEFGDKIGKVVYVLKSDLNCK